MKKMLYIILLIFSLSVLVGCTSFHVVDNYEYDDTNYSIGNKAFITEIKTINVDWIIGNIFVLQSSNHELIIREETDIKSEDVYKMHYYLNDDVLDIKFCGNIKKLDYKFKMKDLYIFLPTTLNEIKINSQSADVDIQNVAIQNIEINNVSGDTMINKLKSDDVEITNVSGETIILDARIEELEITTISGNVGLSFDELTKELDVLTTSGNVVIYLSETQGIELKFKTTSGNLKSNLEYTKQGESYIFKNPQGDYNVITTSGNLTINKK